MREPVQVYLTSRLILRFSPLRSSQKEWQVSQERQRSTWARWQNLSKVKTKETKPWGLWGRASERTCRGPHTPQLSVTKCDPQHLQDLLSIFSLGPRNPPGGTGKACSWGVQCEEVFFEASGAKKGSRFPKVNYFPCEHLIRNFIRKPHLLRRCPLFLK